MKTCATLLILFLTFTSLSFAQNHSMQIGPKAGVNFANLGGDEADDLFGESTNSRTGFNGGLFFMYQFNKMFAIQPEGYYTMKGATADIMGADFTLMLDYIEIPLLFKFLIPVEGSSIKPAIYAGPSVGFNTTAKLKGEYQGESEEEDVKDNVESTEFCLAFGGSLGFMVGNNEVGIDVRYSLGLSSWFKMADMDEEFNEDVDLKNNVLSINAYFGVNLH